MVGERSVFYYYSCCYYRPLLFMSLMSSFEAGSAVSLMGTSFRLRWWTVMRAQDWVLSPFLAVPVQRGRSEAAVCPPSGCWDQFLSITAAPVLHLTVLLLSCDSFLSFLCVLSLFSTHRAQSSPRGPSSSGLM